MMSFGLVFLLGYGCGSSKDPYAKFEQSPFVALAGNQNQLLRINIEQLRSLSIFSDVLKALNENSSPDSWFKSFEAILGTDPFSMVDRMVVGFNGIWDIDDPWANAVLIFRGQFENPQKIISDLMLFCQDHTLLSAPLLNPSAPVRNNFESFTITKIEASLYRNPEEKVQFFFSFPTPRLMIVSRQEFLVKDSLEVMSGTKEGIQSHERWEEVLGTIELGAMIWAVGDLPDDLRRRIDKEAQNVRELSGLENLALATRFNLSLKVDSLEYLLEVALECDSIDDTQSMRDDIEAARPYLATQVEAWFSPQSPRGAIVNSFLERIRLLSQSSTITLLLRVSRHDIEQFVRDLTSLPK